MEDLDVTGSCVIHSLAELFLVSPLLNMSLNASNDEEKRKQLLSVAVAVLNQALDLVENRLTDDSQLSVSAQHLSGSTIGKHLRHAREHFEALLDSASADSSTFSYDSRKRDLPMESSLKGAADALKGTLSRLETMVPRTSINTLLTMNAITPFHQTLKTTFGRELWFCSLHSVHHWALVRVICGEMGIQLADSFGFAPSTLVHQGSTDAPLGKAQL